MLLLTNSKTGDRGSAEVVMVGSGGGKRELDAVPETRKQARLGSM